MTSQRIDAVDLLKDKRSETIELFSVKKKEKSQFQMLYGASSLRR